MRLIFSKKAGKELSKLNPFISDKIIKILKKFENGERVDIQKLKGEDEEFRIRVGDYRVLLKRFSNKDFLVTEIGQRENIYFFAF